MNNLDNDWFELKTVHDDDINVKRTSIVAVKPVAENVVSLWLANGKDILVRANYTDILNRL